MSDFQSISMGLPDVCQFSVRHVALSEQAKAPVGSDSRDIQLELATRPAAFLRWLLLIHEAADCLQDTFHS